MSHLLPWSVGSGPRRSIAALIVMSMAATGVEIMIATALIDFLVSAGTAVSAAHAGFARSIKSGGSLMGRPKSPGIEFRQIRARMITHQDAARQALLTYRTQLCFVAYDGTGPSPGSRRHHFAFFHGVSRRPSADFGSLYLCGL
jgi:hypothetical protein